MTVYGRGRRDRAAGGLPAELLRDEAAWLYLGPYGGLHTRRLRIWRDGGGRLVAVVTEHQGDPGTSITNAAEAILAQLHIEYAEPVDLVEHYTARRSVFAGDMDDEDVTWTLSSLHPDGVLRVDLPPLPTTQPATYDLVTVDPTGSARWTPLSRQDVLDRLGVDLG